MQKVTAFASSATQRRVLNGPKASVRAVMTGPAARAKNGRAVKAVSARAVKVVAPSVAADLHAEDLAETTTSHARRR